MGYTPGDLTEDDFDFSAVEALAQILEQELKSAKSNHLACGEVLLPANLLGNIAQQIYELAEPEPCGIRGCVLYIRFETSDENRLLSTFICDSETPATFELYLTLKQSSNSWNFLPQFLKKIARGGTVMLSPEFEITKNKLYRSYSD